MSALPKAAQAPSPWWSHDRVPLGRDGTQGTGDGGHHGLLPGSTGRLGSSGHGQCRRGGAASLRRPGHRGRSRRAPRMAAVERRHIEAHKLWLAARPGKDGKAPRCRHHPAPPRIVAHLLRAAARLGLRRRTDQDVDLPRRLPPGRRAVAEVPRRPDDGEVHRGTGERPGSPSTGHGRDPGPDRHPGGRALRTRRQGRDLAR